MLVLWNIPASSHCTCHLQTEKTQISWTPEPEIKCFQPGSVPAEPEIFHLSEICLYLHIQTALATSFNHLFVTCVWRTVSWATYSLHSTDVAERTAESTLLHTVLSCPVLHIDSVPMSAPSARLPHPRHAATLCHDLANVHCILTKGIWTFTTCSHNSNGYLPDYLPICLPTYLSVYLSIYLI